MRRFYIVQESVLHEMVSDRLIPYHHLFVSAGGFHYINLGNSGQILLCCDDFKDSAAEAAWHAHPQVARLHHPANERNTSLSTLVNGPKSVGKQFKQKHADALAQIGVTPNHTVWDINTIVSKIHPLVRLDVEY